MDLKNGKELNCIVRGGKQECRIGVALEFRQLEQVLGNKSKYLC